MILISGLLCLACVASEPADSIRFGGRFFPRLVSAQDTAQAYSLLLPLGYAPTQRYPLVLILDPRGQALVPLARFGPPAVRLGYIVMSSYNSASDGPVEPNVGAVNAMLGDAWRALAIDTTRVYLVGFSGTARFSWSAATELRRVVKGIVQVGAGPNPPIEGWLAPFTRDSTFAVFSTAGTTDFNHDEVVELDRRLAESKIPRRTVVFPGAHEWAPESVAAQAIEWLEIRHRLHRSVPADSFVARFRTERLAELDSIRTTADTGEVVRRFAALSRDFPADPALTEYQNEPGMALLLERAPAVMALERQRISDERSWLVEALKLLNSLAKARPATADELETKLDVAATKRRAAEAPAGPDRAAAQRRLSWLFVNAVFYGPRRYRADRAWHPIISLLDLAHRLDRLPPEGCAAATEALAATGQAQAAERYPEC